MSGACIPAPGLIPDGGIREGLYLVVRAEHRDPALQASRDSTPSPTEHSLRGWLKTPVLSLQVAMNDWTWERENRPPLLKMFIFSNNNSTIHLIFTRPFECSRERRTIDHREGRAQPRMPPLGPMGCFSAELAGERGSSLLKGPSCEDWGRQVLWPQAPPP